MANDVNILRDGDTGYTAVYVNGSKVSYTRGSGNEGDIITAVCAALDRSVDKSGTNVAEHDAEDFDFERIWVNGEGFIKYWNDVEAARL